MSTGPQGAVDVGAVLSTLHGLGRTLSGAGSLEQALAPALPRLADLFGARTVLVWTGTPGGELTCLVRWGRSEAERAYARWAGAGPAAGQALAAALHERGEDQLLADDPATRERAAMLAAAGLTRTELLPLRAGGRVVGGLEVGIPDDRPLEPDARAALGVVASLLAHRLAAPTDPELREASALRGALADPALDAFVATDLEGRITVFSAAAERMFGFTAAEAVGRTVAELLIPPSFRPFHEEGMARYRRSQESRVVSQRSRFPALRRDGSQLQVELVVVALPAGFAAFVRDATAEIETERALVEGGQRFAEQARALQRSFLPTSTPLIDGLAVATRYAPAGEDVEVGGDFYDVFEVGGGQWGVAIGDIEGKGIEAASTMGLSRFTLRGLGSGHADLVATVQGLNELLLAQNPCRLCSVVVGRFERTAGGFRFTVVVAGHPPPLVVRAGEVRAVARPEMILGVNRSVVHTEQEVELGPGDVLVLYTDGLTEARTPQGEFLGERRVHDALRRWQELEAEEIARRLEDLALDFQDQRPRDDLALVVAKVAGTPA